MARLLILCSGGGALRNRRGDAKLLVEVFLGLGSGVQQELPRGVDRALNNYAGGYSWLAVSLNSQEKPTDALVAVDKAMRLDPRNPEFYLYDRGLAYMLLARWEDAIPDFKRVLARYPDELWCHAHLGEAYSFTGDDDGAQRETARVKRAVALTSNSAYGYFARRWC